MKSPQHQPSSKRCSRCEEEKSISEFYTKGRSSKGHPYYESHCKACSIRNAVARDSIKRATDPEYRRATNAASSARSSQYQREMRKNPAKRHIALWKDYRNTDRKKGRDNDLTKEFIWEMLDRCCVYCGETEQMSLDRIDNNLGHLQSNVNAACLRCNLVRGDMPYDAWVTIAAAMRAAREAGQFSRWFPKRRG